MAVISLAIYPADDPNGTALVTLTDEDVAEFELRVGENELGTGTFTIRRDHPDATEANLATGNYVKVTIPIISDDPCWAFWLDEHQDTILANDEQGGEFLTRAGFGPLFVLGNMALLNDIWSTSHAFRGNYDVPGQWTWSTEPYGAILKRTIEEGQLEPGMPLGEVTTDFTREDDSDGNPWYTVNEEIQFPIGTDGLTVMRRLVESGELFLRATPDLLVQAYKYRGRDLTGGSFGSGVVRFEKGINIDTDLTRQGHGAASASHAIVVGKDNTYRQVVSPAYTSGPGRWTTVEYDTSNDTGILDKVGAENLRKRLADEDGVEFQLKAAHDQDNGLYLPWVHFLTGDLVTLHTGTEPWDYNEAEKRIVGWRIALGEVSRDTDGDGPNTYLAARSLEIAVELESGPTTGSMGDSTSTGKSGCGCLQLCHDRPNVCAGGAYPVTPSQHFNPLGSGTSDADGYVYYRSPVAALPAPQPGHVGGMGFPSYGGPGAPDYTGDCLSVGVHFVMVGAGTLTIHTAASSSVRTLTATLVHWSGGSQSTDSATAGIAPGSSVVVSIPSDGSDDCVHTVVITDTAGACGGAWGYAGADWVAVNPTSIVGGPTASSGDSVRAAPCDHDHAYTADQISYGSGSVADALAAGTGAPDDATYLVTTAHAGLSAEVVVGATPGGELGGTWASPTVDATHAGSTHDAATNTHIADTTDAHDASAISFVPTGTISATDVQAAIVEAAAEAVADPADDTAAWMPLTTVVGGVPELVWDGSDSLIPTLTPL